MILERLAALSESRNWSLKGPLDLHGKPIENSPTELPTSNSENIISDQPSTAQPPRPSSNCNSTFFTNDATARPAPMRPTAPINQNQTQNITIQQQTTNNASLFSSLRGGAGSFLKNLKDTSSKVMQTMQQTIARTDLDISYITSRILVMPCPSEGFESTYKTNNIEDVRLYIESRFPPQKVSVYNFGTRACPRIPPPVRTVEVGSIYACMQSRAPNLQVRISKTLTKY